jgi:hypothetical protein
MVDKFSLWSSETKLRGANIFQRRVYPEYDGYEILGPGPIGPPLVQADFDSLAAAGANFVVLSHPGVYSETAPHVVAQDALDNLDNCLQMAENAGLYVVIAFRTGPGRSEFTFYRDGTWFDPSDLVETVWTNTTARNGFISMWSYVANRYKYHSSVIGYELMVEPNSTNVLGISDPSAMYPAYANTGYDWNTFSAAITTAIRAVDANTPILVGANGSSDIYWLQAVVPTGDSKTVYVLSEYNPGCYVFQDLEKTGTLPYTYPGSFDIDGDSVPDTVNKAAFVAFFAQISDFKTRTGCQVAVTEFGCARWSPGVDVFLGDKMDIFQTLHVAFAVWQWVPDYTFSTTYDDPMNIRAGQSQASKNKTTSAMLTMIESYWNNNTQLLDILIDFDCPLTAEITKKSYSAGITKTNYTAVLDQ